MAAPTPQSRAALVFAWGGAGAFALSLLYFLVAYLVRYDAVSSRIGTARATGTDIALFSAFALHHSVFARPAAKAWLADRVGMALERSVYTWIASLLFFVVCAQWQLVPGEAYALHGIFAVAGYALQAAGLIITARSSAKLDVLDLAGVRPVIRARQGEPAAHVPLETGGLYSVVRHPLYFGWALFVFGAPRMTMTRLVFAVVSTAYLAIAIPFEERSLIRTFGGAYREYQRRVRWRMIPGLY
jgi:protein-S-isoprenylcysteine O-methyltransferase Ste14